MKKTIALLSVLSALAPMNAFAATGDVLFNGTVNTTCTVLVTGPGTLASANGGNQLSSKAPGGAAGTATVTTTGYGYQVSVANPTAWTAGPTAAASMVADFNFGAADFNTAQTVGLGVQNVNVNLVATAAPATSFANGAYAATVVLTCE